MPGDETADLTWDATEQRIAVLQVLLNARKKSSLGGASAKMLEECLQLDKFQIEFALSYLRPKRLVEENAERFVLISAKGVDYLNEQLAKTKVPETRDWLLAMQVLKVLSDAREKGTPPECTAKVLMELLHIDSLPDVEFALWYLCEKGFAQVDGKGYKITDLGFGYLSDQLAKAPMDFRP